MPFTAPSQRYGGRQKGTPNKVDADIKAMITGALHELGGQEYLVRQGHDNPVAFLGLVGKILPKVVVGDSEKPAALSIEDQRDAVLAALSRAFTRVVSGELPKPKVIEAEAVEVDR